MITKDIKGLIIVFLINITIIALIKFTFIIINKISRKKCNNEKSIAIKQIEIVILEQILIFGLFKWYVSLILWAFIFGINYFLFKKKIPVENLNSDVCKTSKCNKKIQFTGYIEKVNYRNLWINFYISGLSLLLLQLLYSKITILNVSVYTDSIIGNYLFDLFSFSGFLIILYYICRPLSLHGRPKWQHWKKWYTSIFILVYLILQFILFCFNFIL